ncbi:MAG TPA: heavy-metal-associated domain-containing protein [Pseudacidobacterium sp.]|jgi:copper chaperone CopZ|nr:heavy-metal-associated domain-containing protein [Pseudacidobacterium sp.]
MKEITLRIDGMHCGACIRRVTQALQKVEGSEVTEVRVGAARVAVPETAAEPAILDALAKAGYSAHLEQ